MADKTGIAWTDATWNPVTGCEKVSPGCAHCYAEGVAARFWPTQYPAVLAHPLPDHTRAGVEGVAGTAMAADIETAGGFRSRQFTDVMCHEDRLDQPLRWQRPRRIFVNSMSDLFHEAVPDAFIDQVFAVMALAPRHTFQILTKRVERMLSYIRNVGTPGRIDSAVISLWDAWARPNYPYPEPYHPRGFKCLMQSDGPEGWPLPNAWLGVSVENQHFADERVPLLLQTPAAIRFISAEPMLGPVNLYRRWLSDGADCPACQMRDVVIDEDGCCQGCGADTVDRPHGLDWVIVGGESGPKARPCDVGLVRSIVKQCRAARVPCFVKQLGAFSPDDAHGIEWRWKDRKGADPSEWPDDLRVQEFPR